MILQLILLSSLIINGIYFVTREGMIFGFVERFEKKYTPGYWYKPLFGCVTCMASFWNLVLIIPYHYGFGTPFWYWFLIAPACAYVNPFLYTLYERISR